VEPQTINTAVIVQFCKTIPFCPSIHTKNWSISQLDYLPWRSQLLCKRI